MRKPNHVKTLPSRLKKLVTKEGFTVHGLADRLEISESTLRRWMKKPPAKAVPQAVMRRLDLAEYGSRI